MCGAFEILPGRPATQNPFPPPRTPSHPWAATVHGPPGPLPTRRHGSFMAPGRSRRNKIQVVSKVTDWGGGSPLTAGLSWEAPGGRNSWGRFERKILAARRLCSCCGF